MAAGLHVMKGSALWDAYIDFEKAVLNSLTVIVSLKLSYISLILIIFNNTNNFVNNFASCRVIRNNTMPNSSL